MKTNSEMWIEQLSLRRKLGLPCVTPTPLKPPPVRKAKVPSKNPTPDHVKARIRETLFRTRAKKAAEEGRK